jgi:hypothetical protein
MDDPEGSYVANVVVNQFQEEFRGQEFKVSKYPDSVNLEDTLDEYYFLSSTSHRRDLKEERLASLRMVGRWSRWPIFSGVMWNQISFSSSIPIAATRPVG